MTLIGTPDNDTFIYNFESDEVLTDQGGVDILEL